MGQPVSLPVLISPTGVQAVHPDGEVAVARAAASRGTAMGLSSMASKPIEEVVAANPQTFFQVYWSGTREQILQRVERARAAGAVGLIVTLDWSFSHGRDWGSPRIPEQMNLTTMVRFAPEAAVRPRWFYSWARTGRPPDLTVPNLALPGEPAPTFFGAYGEWMQTPRCRPGRTSPGCGSSGSGPFMLKGVDAGRRRPPRGRRRRERDLGVQPRRQQPGRHARHASGRCRRSSRRSATGSRCCSTAASAGAATSLKAVALGARAVMIGRAYLWGLAANGQAGVENVLDILRSGIDSALLGLGHSGLKDLGPADLVIPPGFGRRLGAG